MLYIGAVKRKRFAYTSSESSDSISPLPSLESSSPHSKAASPAQKTEILQGPSMDLNNLVEVRVNNLV